MLANAVLAAAAAPSAVHAADSLPRVAGAVPLQDLGTVTVTAKFPQPLSQAAASVTVVDTAALDGLIARDLADLARYEPGFSVRHDATRFGSGNVAIRGIGGNRVLLEVDGAPSAPAFAVGNFAEAGRTYADLDLVRRIEVLRGPASSLHGSDALGGVVSLQTWDPADLLGSQEFGARLRTSWRGDDGGWLGSAIAAAGTGPADVLVGYAQRDSSELATSSRQVSANPRDARARSWLAKAVFGVDAPLRVTFSRQESEAATDVRSLVLQPGRFANTVVLRGEDTADTTRVVADQQFTDAGPFAQAEWRFYWRRSSVDQQTREQRRAAGPRTPAVAIDRRFRFDVGTAGGEVTVSREFDAWGLGHRLVAGIEADRSGVEEVRDGLQTTIATGAASASILGETFPLRDFPKSTITRAGLYLQDRILPPGSRGAWLPALRVDHERLRPRVDAIYAEDNPRTVPVSLATTAVSPRLGYTWTASEGVTLFAQFAHGFRSPPFEDVNIGLDLPLFNTRAIANPDLKPETSDGLEIGARAERGAVRGTASVYYNRYRNFIESKVNLGPDASGTTIFQSRNLTRARIRGVEAAGSVELGGIAPALAGLRLRGALHHSRGDDTARDRPLNSVDPTKLVLGAGYGEEGDAWGGSVLATFAAAKDRVDDGATQLARTAGWATFDVDGWWRPRAGLELRVAVLNVADRSYYEWADVRGRAAADPSLELYRRAGRSVAASLTWTF